MLSSRLKKNRDPPGSPCLPLRPRNLKDKNQRFKFKYLFDRVRVASTATRMKESSKRYAEIMIQQFHPCFPLLSVQQGKGDKKKNT